MKTNCVVLTTPVYPGIEWTSCDGRPCLSLDNAKLLARYLASVKRYHESIETTCGGLK